MPDYYDVSRQVQHAGLNTVSVWPLEMCKAMKWTCSEPDPWNYILVTTASYLHSSLGWKKTLWHQLFMALPTAAIRWQSWPLMRMGGCVTNSDAWAEQDWDLGLISVNCSALGGHCCLLLFCVALWASLCSIRLQISKSWLVFTWKNTTCWEHILYTSVNAVV